MDEIFSGAALAALGQIVLIDLVLAGDNAIVIGLAAAGLPREQRTKAIAVGILGATVLRILFASITTQLLGIVGIILAGGILLLWVSWKMWRELRISAEEERAAQEALALRNADGAGLLAKGGGRKSFRQAAIQIVAADVSMSLDNVLAVAGAAHGHHLSILVFGLALSILLMGVAATLVARLLQRWRWIAYVGLAVILYVALGMIYEGVHQLLPGEPDEGPAVAEAVTAPGHGDGPGGGSAGPGQGGE